MIPKTAKKNKQLRDVVNLRLENIECNAYVTCNDGLDLSSLNMNGILNEVMEEVSIHGIPAIQNSIASS